MIVKQKLIASTFIALLSSLSISAHSSEYGWFQLAQISQSQAASIAKADHGGKVLSVQKLNDGGKTIYKVKLLMDSGRIKIVRVDGQSGN